MVVLHVGVASVVHSIIAENLLLGTGFFNNLQGRSTLELDSIELEEAHNVDMNLWTPQLPS